MDSLGCTRHHLLVSVARYLTKGRIHVFDLDVLYTDRKIRDGLSCDNLDRSELLEFGLALGDQ